MHDGVMTADLVLHPWEDLTTAQAQRWSRVLGTVVTALSGVEFAVVDSHRPDAAAVFADRLASTARDRGRDCVRLSDSSPVAAGTLAVADGSVWRQHHIGQGTSVIWLRTPAPPGTPADHRDKGASVVVDLHDGVWPVIRHISPDLVPHSLWYRAESQAFFGIRARTWDTKFGDDMPAYASAVAEAVIAAGGTVIDLGCGTGRALPTLRDAVGAAGSVIGIDHTREMLDVACASGRAGTAMLIQCDARQLPLGDCCADAVFAAGLVTHLPDLRAGLRELARVTRAGGTLILFHPSGRAALAARHGRAMQPGEPLDQDVLDAAMDATGWRLTTHDDPPNRFLAIATRR